MTVGDMMIELRKYLKHLEVYRGERSAMLFGDIGTPVSEIELVCREDIVGNEDNSDEEVTFYINTDNIPKRFVRIRN